MVNIHLAEKAARQSLKRNIRNKKVKSEIKTVIKKLQEDNCNLSEAVSIIHKAAKKGVIKKNTTSRKISRLTHNLQKKEK